MQKKGKNIVLARVAIGLSLVAFVVLGVLAYLYFQPLAAPLAVVTQAPPTVVSGAASNPPAAIQQETVCGRTGSLLILLTGEDFSKGVWPLGADTVRVARIDYSSRQITVVGFPRDLWVQTPGLAGLDHPETRLGLAYHYKKESTAGAEDQRVTAATGQVAQALYDNFGLEPEKYFTIQLQNTPAMIDAIGGIEIDVPRGFTSEYGVTFEAGPQHMDGARAAEYVRAWAESENEGDLLRFPRQNVLIKAVQDKMLSADILTRVPELYARFDQSIVTDLSPQQIGSLACMAKEVDKQDIRFYEVAGDLVTEQENFVLIPDVERVKQALQDWLN